MPARLYDAAFAQTHIDEVEAVTSARADRLAAIKNYLRFGEAFGLPDAALNVWRDYVEGGVA